MIFIVMDMARKSGNEEVAPEPGMDGKRSYSESQRPMTDRHLSKGLVNDGYLSVLTVGYEPLEGGTATNSGSLEYVQ